MGIFSDLRALTDVQRIKSGGTAKLSISQIVNLNINLPDAKEKLSEDEFAQIYALYNKMRKCTTKIPMDADAYFNAAFKIVEEFDKIAPYEDYCGGNAFEISFMFSGVYGVRHKEIRKLRRERYKMDRRLSEFDATFKKNSAIFKNSYSDEQIARLVSTGQFSQARATEYKQSRDAIEMYIQSAPGIRNSILSMIQDLENQIAQLMPEK